MSTAELIGGRAGPPGEPAAALGTRPRAAVGLPLVLTVALLLVLLYAAFDHGAVSLPVEARIQVALAALAAVAAAGWLWTGSLRLAAPRLAVVGAGLLAAFACWSGVTVLWSVAPDQTWIELNRAIAYVLVLGLAIAIGASHPRAVEVVARGFLVIALAVTVYGIGQKLFPGLHVKGLFNLNQTGPLPRLQEPLGYWNALALFVVMGVPIALAIAADSRQSARTRLGALVAVELMLLVVAFAYSRGGLLALAIALIVGMAVSGGELRSLMWPAVVVVTTIPPLLFGLLNHSLTSANVSLSSREAAGAELAAILAASLAVLIVAGRRLLALEPQLKLDRLRARITPGRLAAAVGVLLACAVLAMSLSSRGLGGTVSHAWKSFATTKATTNYDPHRLLSADSENRWVWWKEAAGAFSDRPIGGWGAGSFPVVHLLYRRDSLAVKQPHSVPLQFLAETGIVGGLLALGGLGLLLAAATRGVRRHPRGGERLLAAALLAGVVAYAVHSLYDWDWDIPAVTFPPMIFLGVLVARHRKGDAPSLEGPGPGTRVLWVGGLALLACMFAVSAVVPSLAASKASSALVQAASGSRAALDRAQRSAALSSSLDPLSDAGLRAEATVAVRRGQLNRARGYLLDAVRRDPNDVQAWDQLAAVDLLRRDTPALIKAIGRLVALDPRGQLAKSLLPGEAIAGPPRDSATAIPTPLPGS